MRVKKVILFSVLLLLIFGASIFYYLKIERQNVITPLGAPIFEKPLDKYTFENLRKKEFKPNEIILGKVLKDDPDFTSRIFYFGVEGKRVSGMINLPKKAGTYPVIVMFRGFVPKEKYSIGEGTRHSAEVFTSPPAGGGFITLAPDFLGYGESASPSADSIEERFQTYTTALTLLKSIDNLNNALSKCESTFYLNKLEYQNSKFETISNNQNLNAKDVFENLRIGILNLFRISDFGFGVFAATDNTTNNKTPCINNVLADPKKVGIWGHSNGGHIALSILELTGKNYPTVLWAPVSKPFPYSILYYTDEFDDHGKALRKVLANFEKNYDVEKYSPTNYLKWVNAKMQIHQGGNDEEVPQKWSDNLTVELKKLDKEIEYFVYPSQDHNFSNSEAWTKAVLRSIEFYRKNFNF